MKLTEEQLKKYETANTPIELIEMAKSDGVTLSEEDAAIFFAENLNKLVPLSDDELEKVAGGGHWTHKYGFEVWMEFEEGEVVIYRPGTNGDFAISVVQGICDYVPPTGDAPGEIFYHIVTKCGNVPHRARESELEHVNTYI